MVEIDPVVFKSQNLAVKIDKIASKLILFRYFLGKKVILTKTIAAYMCGIKTMVIRTDARQYL